MVRKSQEEERNALQAQLLESERRMISFKLKVTINCSYDVAVVILIDFNFLSNSRSDNFRA